MTLLHVLRVGFRQQIFRLHSSDRHQFLDFLAFLLLGVLPTGAYSRPVKGSGTPDSLRATLSASYCRAEREWSNGM